MNIQEKRLWALKVISHTYLPNDNIHKFCELLFGKYMKKYLSNKFLYARVVKEELKLGSEFHEKLRYITPAIPQILTTLYLIVGQMQEDVTHNEKFANELSALSKLVESHEKFSYKYISSSEIVFNTIEGIIKND